MAGVGGADLGAATISYNTADGQAPVNAGSYVATGTFAGNDNYAEASNTATIVIAKATPTVTVQPVSVTFDGQAHETTGTVAGVGGADLGAATISYNTADGQAPVNAGSYVATGTFAGNDNYAAASNTAAIVIAKATPTVTVQAVSVTFDGQAHGTTGTVAGVGGADLGAATISYNTADGQAPVNAGSYVATGTFAGNDNYAAASNTAAIVIAKATPTVTVQAVSVTFDGDGARDDGDRGGRGRRGPGCCDDQLQHGGRAGAGERGQLCRNGHLCRERQLHGRKRRRNDHRQQGKLYDAGDV